MNPERYRKIKHIFHQAAEIDAAERVDFLRENCTDADVRREVEKMLGFVDSDNDTLEKNAYEIVFKADQAKMPERIGEYRILREIGRGGMGAVFEAVRERPNFSQRVALKIIKRGMDTDAILNRFRYEQQILSSLEHSYIARFLDGGMTDDGLPFYAMEFVEGIDIDKYCREHDLSVQDRLKLFRQVCTAVQYAHQNFIAHRDLKPNNILVTRDGTPKLLDFGIAKVLSTDAPEKTGTATQLGMMTPAYASPEQIRGEKVGAQSDIYSLGVILYELLTGQKPYKISSGSHAELEKAVLSGEPVRPSSVAGLSFTLRQDAGKVSVLKPESGPAAGERAKASGQAPKKHGAGRKLLRGDLDNIILKALKKEPERRYATVEQFSEDIRRHLEGLPVTARPDTFKYRTSRFIKRNKASVVTAAVVFFALVGGILGTTYQARIARAERLRAEKRFEQVRNLASNVVFKYHDAIADLQGSTAVREMLVRDALHYLDALAEEAGGDLELQKELALAYLKLADVQGKAYAANVGDTEGALASYRKSIALLEEVAQSAPADLRAREKLVSAYDSLTLLLTRTGGGQKAADELMARALTLNEELLRLEPENNEIRRQFVELLIRSGDLAAGLEGNLREHLKALPFAEELARKAPDDPEITRTLVRVYQRVGTDYQRLGAEAEQQKDDGRAGELFRQSLVYHQKMYETTAQIYRLEPEKPVNRRYLALASINLGETLARNGLVREAVEMLEKAKNITEETLHLDPKNSETKFDLAIVHETMGSIYRSAGELRKAVEHYRQSILLAAEIFRTDAKKIEALNHVRLNSDIAAAISEMLGDKRSAEAYRRKSADAVAAFERFFKENRPQ